MNFIYKIIYSPFINFFLRNINKAFQNLFPSIKIPPSGVIRIKLKDHSTIWFQTNQTDFVGFCLFWKGLYNYEYTSVFEKIIEKCNGFIDVGSNGGLYSLIAAKRSEKIKVLAFDPTNAAIYFLNKNIILNHLSDKITAYQIALSDNTGETDFFEVRNKKYPYLKYNLGGSSSLINLPADYNQIRVKSFSFDDFIKQYAWENLPIDFIKVDAEGAEPLIINGMIDTIRNNYPIIVCEILPDETGNKLEEIFIQHNYAFFMYENTKLIPVKTLHDEENEIIRNCFFVHPSKFHLIEEFVNQ